ncbi:MAG: serine hydrolase [Patescibacteria group bacterium]|nr:serine hydrolase [Patescibacteria group bacterium]MDD5490556.1 serine hydrolase [Patescibacteria group bacterium]
MKKALLLFLIFLFCPSFVWAAEKKDLSQIFAGRILLQVESYGRAWYVNPASGERYYLKDGAAAYEAMRRLGLGITNKDLEKIPEKAGETMDKKLVERVKGKILIQVESRGEAWYVNPADGLRYYLKDGQSAFAIMRRFGKGIANKDLAKIPMNRDQITSDYTFNSVAYAKLTDESEAEGSNIDKILPLASLTKLMTALVLLDLNLDWNKEVIITAAALNYPKDKVGEDATSEVDLQEGDRVSFRDLWVAMLVASSNQAAVALADSAGLPREEFVYLMNAKAESFGLKKTKFFDMTGLDSHNVSTPKEMALLAKTAFAFPEIADTSKSTEYVINTPSRSIKVNNRNYSLLGFNPDGVKTGFLVEAQRNVALKKGKEIIVVLHALSMKQRDDIIKKLLALK